MRAVAVLIVAAATVYVVARAASVGFTYDESYSYFHLVEASLGTVVGFRGEVTANNHTLNSLLMTLAKQAFGNSELALRLPNVLAFVGYGAAALFLMRRFRHVTSKALAGVLLLLNPFLLEIFSLARGYGLGLCFVMGSLAALAAAVDPASERRLADRRLAQGAAIGAFSVFANLAFLNYFLPFLLVVVALRLRLWRREVAGQQSQGGRRNARVIQALAAPAVWLGVVSLYAIPAVLRLRKLNELYYGGRTGFWSDTVDSLIRCWLYVQPYSAALKPVIGALVLLVIAVAAVLVLRPSPEERTGRLELLRAVASILVVGAAASVLAHALLGTPYLINRTAAWMLPCFLVVLVLEVDIGQGSRARFVRIASAAGSWVLIAASLAHGISAANMHHAILQYHDADTKDMLRDLQRVQGLGTGIGRGLTLLASWELLPAIEYYRVTRPLPWLESVTDTPGTSDVAFLSKKDVGLLGRRVTWKRYPITRNILAVTPELLPATQTPDPGPK